MFTPGAPAPRTRFAGTLRPASFYSGGACPPDTLRGDPYAPLLFLLRGPLPPGRASLGTPTPRRGPLPPGHASRGRYALLLFLLRGPLPPDALRGDPYA